MNKGEKRELDGVYEELELREKAWEELVAWLKEHKPGTYEEYLNSVMAQIITGKK